MKTYNNTHKVNAYINHEINGVVLPGCSRVLSYEEVQQSIEKTENHILSLKDRIAERNTHGGKNYRTKTISLKDQISFAEQRLEILLQAKGIIEANNSKHLEVSPLVARTSKKTDETLSNTDRKIQSIVARLFGW